MHALWFIFENGTSTGTIRQNEGHSWVRIRSAGSRVSHSAQMPSENAIFWFVERDVFCCPKSASPGHNATRMADLRNLRINVKVTRDDDGRQETVQAGFCCDVCSREIEVYSDGPSAVHTVVCPTHGKIASFPSYDAYTAFAKEMTDRLLLMNGDEPISPTAKLAVPEVAPDKMN
jgi:hypothetical protein